MITFRTVSDSLGEALFFQVDGRDGRVEVFFADMLDAPTAET